MRCDMENTHSRVRTWQKQAGCSYCQQLWESEVTLRRSTSFKFCLLYLAIYHGDQNTSPNDQGDNGLLLFMISVQHCWEGPAELLAHRTGVVKQIEAMPAQWAFSFLLLIPLKVLDCGMVPLNSGMVFTPQITLPRNLLEIQAEEVELTHQALLNSIPLGIKISYHYVTDIFI